MSRAQHACTSSSHCNFCLTDTCSRLLSTVTNATSHNTEKILARLVLASSCQHTSITDILQLGHPHCIMHQQNAMASSASDAWLYHAPCSSEQPGMHSTMRVQCGIVCQVMAAATALLGGAMHIASTRCAVSRYYCAPKLAGIILGRMCERVQSGR